MSGIRDSFAAVATDPDVADAEEADEASELMSYLFNATLQKCNELDAEGGNINLKNRLQHICSQANASGLLEILSEKINDAAVAQWLCSVTGVATDQLLGTPGST